MKIEKVKKLSPLRRLAYWINERESIRRKRALGLPFPLTDDEILQRFRFCNVRRMDDKVSLWLLKNWYEPFRNHSNMLPAIALARFFNLPSSLGRIEFPTHWNTGKMIATLREAKKDGPVFNGAYMVRGHRPEDGSDKIEAVIMSYCNPLVGRDDVIDRTSMQNTHTALLDFYGMGSFVAGQIVSDLRWAITGTWRDKKSWAPIGPGSKRGMNRLQERETDAPLQQKQFEEELLEMQNNLSLEVDQKILGRLEAIDFQSCLCEYDKYVRTLTGESKPKQLYPGRGV